MDTKLTLKLNQEIIEKAKIYASEKKLSLSRLIENYLNSLTSEKKNDEIQRRIWRAKRKGQREMEQNP